MAIAPALDAKRGVATPRILTAFRRASGTRPGTCLDCSSSSTMQTLGISISILVLVQVCMQS